jgi:hypothetical protein
MCIKSRSSFTRKVSVALLFVTLLMSGSQLARSQMKPRVSQQSNCFTISIVATSDLTCNWNNCDVPAGQCEHCYEVTITNDKCPGLTLQHFSWATPGDNNFDCRTFCSPDNDFTITSSTQDTCSWFGPRTFSYTGNNGNGLTYGNSFRMFLCRKQNSIPGIDLEYVFSVVGGLTCGGTPCGDAKIIF